MNTFITIFNEVWVTGLQLSHKKCIEALVRAMLITLSINLVRLARECFTNVGTLTTVRRIERLLCMEIFSVSAIGRAIVKVLPQQRKYILSMDRTTWELGKRVYNILAVGICYDGISIPVYFTTYDKRGATKVEEQISFMEEVMEIIPPEKIYCLVADREFGYSDFIKWLYDVKIPFCLRIRENSYIHNSTKNKNVKVKDILRSLSPDQSEVLSDTYLVKGKIEVRIYAARRRLRDGDGLIILATPKDSKFTDKMYRLRWQIETAFRAMKSAGFNMEETHLPLNGRFQNMLSLVLIAYACAFCEGLIKLKEKTIPIMKSNGRKRFSIFSWGLYILIPEICKESPSSVIDALDTRT